MMATVKAKTKTKLFSKKSLVLVVALLVLLLGVLAGYKIYTHHQQQNQQFKADQANFKQAETTMAAAYSAITQSVGQPFETHLDKSCGYVSLKFKPGSLRCGITYSFSYESTAIETGASESRNIQNAVAATPLQLVVGGNVGLTDTNKSYSDGIEGITGLNCSLNYDLTANDLYAAQIVSDSPYKKTSSSAYVAEYQLSCSNGTTRPLYASPK